MKLLLENWRQYLNVDEGERLYHFSNEKFDKFSLDSASDSAIWGKGVYLSDNPDDLSGWGKVNRSHGFLYKVVIKTDQKNIIDMTQPITSEIYERIEEHIGRPLADITKEDGLFPFNILDRKYGSVANAMRKMGFKALKHPPPGAHKGNHYLVPNPSDIEILKVEDV